MSSNCVSSWSLLNDFMSTLFNRLEYVGWQQFWHEPVFELCKYHISVSTSTAFSHIELQSTSCLFDWISLWFTASTHFCLLQLFTIWASPNWLFVKPFKRRSLLQIPHAISYVFFSSFLHLSKLLKELVSQKLQDYLHNNNCYCNFHSA